MSEKPISSIPRRLAGLKNLVRDYFDLSRGDLIEKHTEKIRVFDIRGSKHPKHPHKMSRVYITRRALKHFVESRKEELLRTHSPESALELVCFAIEHIQETITDFDKYEFEPPTHTYTKDFSHLGKPRLRIMMDIVDTRLEIKSIHFNKRK